MAIEYCKMWPSECNASGVLEADAGQTNCNLPTQLCTYYDTAKAHDPVLMISNNSGKSWRLVNTPDLKSIIIGQ